MKHMSLYIIWQVKSVCLKAFCLLLNSSDLCLFSVVTIAIYLEIVPVWEIFKVPVLGLESRWNEKFSSEDRGRRKLIIWWNSSRIAQKAEIVTPKIIKDINHYTQINWEYFQELVGIEYHHRAEKKENVLILIIFFTMRVKCCLPHLYS